MPKKKEGIEVITSQLLPHATMLDCTIKFNEKEKKIKIDLSKL
jgi:hypothetical protein